MQNTTKKWDYSKDPLCVYRKTEYRAGTTRNFFDAPTSRRNIGWHSPSFVYILEGTGNYVHQETGKKYPFRPGTLILKKPDCLFDQNHAPGLYIDKYMIFPKKIYDFFMEESGLPQSFLSINYELDANVCRKFDELIDEFRFQSEKRLPVTILKFCTFAANLLLPEQADFSSYKSGLEKAIRILESDFAKKISVDELANIAGMSQTNFRRIFRKYYGIAPGEYRLRKKVDAIRDYMLNNRASMKELAQKFGYSDAFAFSHQFKLYSGISPKEFYQKKHSAFF